MCMYWCAHFARVCLRNKTLLNVRQNNATLKALCVLRCIQCFALGELASSFVCTAVLFEDIYNLICVCTSLQCTHKHVDIYPISPVNICVQHACTLLSQAYTRCAYHTLFSVRFHIIKPLYWTCECFCADSLPAAPGYNVSVCGFIHTHSVNKKREENSDSDVACLHSQTSIHCLILQ